ncbi:putative nuclease, contains PIN domain, potential toxin-antitoxin system component [Candidatus Fervidibacteria bacterium JGI MDM2 SSWTFF-3-K9]
MATKAKGLKIYLDECISPDLASAMRQRGWDVISAHEVGLVGVTDEEQLEFAAQTGRVLLTFDIRDFQELAKRWLQQGREHAGILLCQHLPKQAYGRLLQRLEQVRSILTAEQIHNTVVWLGAAWDKPPKEGEENG